MQMSIFVVASTHKKGNIRDAWLYTPIFKYNGRIHHNRFHRRRSGGDCHSYTPQQAQILIAVPRQSASSAHSTARREFRAKSTTDSPSRLKVTLNAKQSERASAPSTASTTYSGLNPFTFSGDIRSL